MTDDTKRPGRPKADDPRVIAVTAWLSSKEYQHLLDIAKRDEQALSATLREALMSHRPKG
jgi:hypothetical protein